MLACEMAKSLKMMIQIMKGHRLKSEVVEERKEEDQQRKKKKIEQEEEEALASRS